MGSDTVISWLAGARVLFSIQRSMRSNGWHLIAYGLSDQRSLNSATQGIPVSRLIRDATKCEVDGLYVLKTSAMPGSVATRLRPVFLAGKYHRTGSIVSIRTTGSSYSDLNFLMTLVAASLHLVLGLVLRWSAVSALPDDEPNRKPTGSRYFARTTPPFSTLDRKGCDHRHLPSVSTTGSHPNLGRYLASFALLMAAMLLSGGYREGDIQHLSGLTASYLPAYDSLFAN